MPTKIYNLDDVNILDTIETITEGPQPVYLYYYSGDSDYLLVSEKEIDEDDLETVANDLIKDLEEIDDKDLYDDET